MAARVGSRAAILGSQSSNLKSRFSRLGVKPGALAPRRGRSVGPMWWPTFPRLRGPALFSPCSRGNIARTRANGITATLGYLGYPKRSRLPSWLSVRAAGLTSLRLNVVIVLV